MANKRSVTTGRRNYPRQEEPGEADSDVELKVVHGRHKRRKRHLFFRTLVRLILVALIVGGGIYVWQNWDNLAPESVLIWANEKLSGQKGDGFPVEITGSSVLSMAKTEDGLALLSDTNFMLLNNNGGQMVQRQHGFSKPILKTAGKYSLIAETGGSRIRVETLSATLLDMTINTHITEAAMGKNGDFALVTDSSQGYTSEVVVYNKHKDEVFHWYSSDLTVTDVALGPDGRSMAVVGVTADAGAMKSSTLLFNFDKKDPVAQYQDTDLLLCSVGYFPNGTVAAIGDQAVWVLNKSGSIQQKTGYGNSTLVGFTIGDNSVSVVLSSSESANGGTLLTVNPTGDKAYSIAYDGTYRSIAPCSSGVLLLTSEHLYRVNASGTSATSDTARDGRLVCALGDKAVILGMTSITECNIPTS